MNSRGALGHTGIILNKNQNYYRINEDFVKKIKAKDVFENSLGKPVFKYKLPSR